MLGLAALAAVVVLGVAAGSVAVAPGDTIGILLRAVGLPLERTWAATAETIVLELRLPRVLTAAVVGAGLAVAGATFQGLLRNPLADPYVLGTASGAALGAAIAVLIPVRIALVGLGLLNVLAFAGGLAAVAVVYRLGRGGPLAPLTGLLLTGYAVGSLLAAGLAMTMYLSGANLRQIFSFLLGGLEGSSWTSLAVAAPLVIGGSIAILARARALNGLLLGEEAAAHLGVDVRRERGILLGLATLVTAAAVAVSGLIGFIGLVAPHLVRLVVGPNARNVVPLAAILGAVLLVVADLVARLLGEIPVGVVTAVDRGPLLPRPAAHGARRIRAVTVIAATARPAPDPAPVARRAQAAFEDVVVAYRERTIIRGVSLAIAPGERVALVGPNGAGKSTLLRVLAGLVVPRSGRVLLGGDPVASLDRPAIARRLAAVPGQATFPFSARVEEVVALGRLPHEDPFRGPRAADRAAVDAAISRVGIDRLRGSRCPRALAGRAPAGSRGARRRPGGAAARPRRADGPPRPSPPGRRHGAPRRPQRAGRHDDPRRPPRPDPGPSLLPTPRRARGRAGRRRRAAGGRTDRRPRALGLRGGRGPDRRHGDAR